MCAIFFLMLCFTGLLLLFRGEIYALLGSEKFSFSSSFQQVSRQKLWESALRGLDEAKEKSQGVHLQSILLSVSEGKVYYRFTREDKKKKNIKRQNTVQVIYYPFSLSKEKFEIRHWEKDADVPFVQSFMKFIHVLHVHLGIGSLGRQFLGFMCGITMLCLLSGVILYPNFMKRVLFAKTKDVNHLRTWFNWHKFTGIVTFSWAVILIFTGIFIAIFSASQFNYEESIRQQIPKTETKIEVATDSKYIQNIILFLEKNYPTQEILSLYFTPEKNYCLAYINEGENKVPFVRQAVYLVPSGDEFLAYTENVPLGVKFVRLMYNLHLNNHDSYILKIIWAFLDVLTIYMVLSGFIAWRKRFSKHKLDRSSIKKGEVIPFQTAKDIWQKPFFITILGFLGMFLPLYGNVGEFCGIIAWICMIFMAVQSWIKTNKT